MAAECCGPVLEEVLALKSRGLESLALVKNPSLIPLGSTFAQIIWNENLNIQAYCLVDLNEGELDEEEDEEDFYDEEDLRVPFLTSSRLSSWRRQDAIVTISERGWACVSCGDDVLKRYGVCNVEQGFESVV